MCPSICLSLPSLKLVCQLHLTYATGSLAMGILPGLHIKGCSNAAVTDSAVKPCGVVSTRTAHTAQHDQLLTGVPSCYPQAGALC